MNRPSNDPRNNSKKRNGRKHSGYMDIYSDESKRKDEYVDIYSSEKKKSRGIRVSFAKVFSVLVFTILGTLGGLLIYVYNTLHSFNYDDLNGTGTSSTADDFENDELSDKIMNDSMVLNILLIGSDSVAANDNGRSDSLLVLSFNIKNKKIKITSIMRDTWVVIPGHGKDRINAAYSYGGAKLSIETVERNFGILIDRYAAVDFEGFSKIIDTLGGIDIDLTSSEVAYINRYSGDKHTLRGSGLTHLTGLQALHYSRNRNSSGSDYDRTERQRTVIKTVINTMKTANVAQITEIVATLGPTVTTNFKISEISRMAKNALTYLNYPIEEFSLPTDNNVRDETYDQKMVLVINDMIKTRSDLSAFIYEDIYTKSKLNQNVKS